VSSASRDDETGPFPLERAKDDDNRAFGASRDETSPFPLERKSAEHERVDVEGMAIAPDVEPPRESEPAAAHAIPTIQFTAAARSARRSLVVALGVHAMALLAFASLSLARWARGLASPPELALTVVAIGIALLHLRASSGLSRLGRDEKRDGAILASTLTGLRAVLVMKALVLFASLALVCFALSMVVSLIASL
jgi:hypothetical protein